MKKNKLLLVLMSGVLTFTAMPSVYASNSSETLTSEKSKTIQNNSSSLSESALNDSEQTESDTNTANSENTSSAISDDDTTVNTSDNETITSESSNETTEKSSSEEKTPQEKAVEETLANLPKMELRPDLGPGYYQVESESKTRSKRSLAAPTMSNTELFLSQIKAGAISGWKKYKVLPSLTGAQAALESGWGSSGLSLSANNLFGIKGRYNGQFELWPTLEFINGQWVTVNAEFRKYPSWKESMEDHGKFLVENPRYYKVLGEKDYIKATNEIWLAGYATDPDYPGKLQRTITYNNLTVWDTEAFGGNNLADYHTKNPGRVTLLTDGNYYKSTSFSDATKGAAYKKGTVVDVQAISYTSAGTPRLKISDTQYVSAKKTYSAKQVANPQDYHLENPGTVELLTNGNYYSSVNFSDATKGSAYKKGTVVKVQDIDYTKAGTPRLKISNSQYISAKKTYSKVQEKPPVNNDYHTINPGTVVMLTAGNYYSSVNFSDATKGSAYKKGTVAKVQSIAYTAAGTPRLKISNNKYISGKKTYSAKQVSNPQDYHMSNPGTVILLTDGNYYKSTNFSEATKGAAYKKGTAVKVKEIDFTSSGTPRLKLTNNQYVSGKKTYSVKQIANPQDYHMSNPGTVILLTNGNYYNSVDFSDATKGAAYKKGTAMKVKEIDYTISGTPRLKLSNNKYVSAKKTYSVKQIANAQDYHMQSPGNVVLLTNDHYYKSATISDANKGAAYKKGTVVKVEDVVFTSGGTPRLKLTNNRYISAKKTYSVKEINNSNQYHMVNPLKVRLLTNDHYYKSATITEANKGAAYKKGTVVEVEDVVYTNGGTPRLKISGNRYISGKKTYSEKIK